MNRNEVVKLLHELGIPSHLKGFKYLVDSVLLFHNKKQLKDTYYELSIKHNTSVFNIERSIRYSIEISFNNGNYKLIDQLFGYSISSTKDKPSNKLFIYTLFDRLTEQNY